MNKQAGVWVDHRKAVIVIVTPEGEEVHEVISDMEKRVRFTGGTASEDGSTEDVRDRQYGNHLDEYYDILIAWIHDSDVVQIFGPGEAKGELVQRLRQKKFHGHVLAVEAMDKMTDRQIAAKVREHFRTGKRPGKSRQNHLTR